RLDTQSRGGGSPDRPESVGRPFSLGIPAVTPAHDVVTFDCYGTLIDWEDGIGSAFRSEAAADGVVLDPSRVVAAYHGVEPEVEATQYRPYRDVLSETSMRVWQRLGGILSRDCAT